MTFVDLRDRYGITQIVFNNEVRQGMVAGLTNYLMDTDDLERNTTI